MDAGAQHMCKGSRCDACPKNTRTDNAAEGILLDCCCAVMRPASVQGRGAILPGG